MEIHPILEPGDTPQPRLWYVLAPRGEPPSMRVGHTCNFMRASNQDSSSRGKLLIVGGANPSGSFADTFVLDLDTFEWNQVEWPGLRARYEHTAFVPESQPNCLYVFGGADQQNNFNDIQFLNTASEQVQWKSVTVEGKAPSPRTVHTTASIGDRLFVFSGGQNGADPVADRQLHVFNAVSLNWSQPNVSGQPPKPRHGHVMAAVGNRLYVHGGMSGTKFYDDLYELDTVSWTWKEIKTRERPGARTAHGAVPVDNKLFIFGGMNQSGALDDVHVFDPASKKWSKVETGGPPPASRLDFATCLLPLRMPAAPASETNQQSPPPPAAQEDVTETKESSEVAATSATEASSESSKNAAGPEETALSPLAAIGGDHQQQQQQHCETAMLCLVNAGMDTDGEVFDDILVLLLS